MKAVRNKPVIRHATLEDVDAIVRIFSGPLAIRGTLQLPFPSPEVWRQRLAEPEAGLVPLVACVDAEPLGMLGIHTRPEMPRLRHSAMIGMAVRDDWQKRGLGTALLRAAVDMADNWLQLTRLELQVFVDNTPAIRLYEKFGFEKEGTLRQGAVCEGILTDVLLMGRIKRSGQQPGPGLHI
jgi:putative acetyltransferase